MWEWLWEITQPLQGPVDTPPAVVETVECQPGFTYSDWEMVRQERRFEGTWVVDYRHYARTKTDVCTDESVRQTKVEGPFRLWPAVPHQYVENVSRPTGGTEVLGTPLRSSDYPGGPGLVQVGPVNRHVLENAHRGPGPGGAPLNITAFIILAGALAFAATRKRYLSLFVGGGGAGEGFLAGTTAKELSDAVNSGVDSWAQQFDEHGYVAEEGADDSYDGELVAADPVGTGTDAGKEIITPQPILVLEGNSRDPGWAEGYPSGLTGHSHETASSGSPDTDQTGAETGVSQLREDGTDPITTLEDNSRIAGDWVEMSNYPNDDSIVIGDFNQDSVLICTPVKMTPAQEWLINLADRVHSKLDSFLQLATGADLDEWRNFGQLSGWKRLQMVGGIATTVGTLGLVLIMKKLDQTETGHKVLNFISELATGGTSEEWANFGELGWKKQAWMIGNSAVTLASFLLPPLALSKAAPLLKGAPGLVRVAVKGAAASKFGRFVGSVAARVSESWAGRAFAGAARWVGNSRLGQVTKSALAHAEESMAESLARAMHSKVIQAVVRYSRNAVTWVWESGFRTATDYLKLDPRNPLIQRLIDKLGGRYSTGLGLGQKFKAIFTETRAAKWFAQSRVGRALAESQLRIWHAIEGWRTGNWVEHALEGLENLLGRRVQQVTNGISSGRIPVGSQKARSLQEVLKALQGAVRVRREVETLNDLKDDLVGWFSLKEDQSR